MQYPRRVEERPADAGCEPRHPVLTELPVTQHKIGFLGRMGMIGIAHARRQKRYPKPCVAMWHEPARPDDHRICMTIEIRLVGIGRIATTFIPSQRRLKPHECPDKVLKRLTAKRRTARQSLEMRAHLAPLARAVPHRDRSRDRREYPVQRGTGVGIAHMITISRS